LVANSADWGLMAVPSTVPETCGGSGIMGQFPPGDLRIKVNC
jgi:hypothetical protein